MNEVHILDTGGSELLIAKFKESHFVLMAQRGWIREDQWLIETRTVLTMSLEHFKEFIKEAE